MRNVHLMTNSGVGLELFEFLNPISQMKALFPCRLFHICLIVEDIVESIEKVVLHGGKQRSKSGISTKVSRIISCTPRILLAISLNFIPAAQRKFTAMHDVNKTSSFL